MRNAQEGRSRVVIEGVSPQVDGGRFAVKRTRGEAVVVEADVFVDGHDQLDAVLLWKREGARSWNESPMRPLVNDRWCGEFPVEELGRYRYTVRGWVDPFKTWQSDLRKRVDAGQDVSVELEIGAERVEEALRNASGDDATFLEERVRALRGEGAPAERTELALDERLLRVVTRNAPRAFATQYDRELPVVVDPERARFSAWYEMFPRSAGEASRHGTFRDVEARLDYVAEMGFDVLYLPPIHPIGRTFRKGRNNTVTPEPDDVGSPWAIGAKEGGHKAIHPELGTLEDFRRLVRSARGRDIQLALDVAFQVSPDHPYVRSHPEWFRKRPDGTIQYAENPPKKYQDIYPFDFETDAWESLWEELKSVFEYWIEQGVTIFRVDNPHTKAFPFWEWCIADLKRAHPETIFLSEAFTRPKVMYRLAKLGFTQSYTYFPWRNTRHELVEYLTELTRTPVREYFRPNHWPNTPDILTAYLQYGGRPAFVSRLVLAATLGASYGVYGPAFELIEGRAVREGSEEYLDSEKYQIRNWDLDRPDSLRHLIARVNRIRKDNVALQSDWSLRFHETDNEQLLCYSKVDAKADDAVLVVVNVDPHHRQSGWVTLDLETLGIEGPSQPFQVHDLLSDTRFLWEGPRNYVELEPQVLPAHVFRVHRSTRREQDFQYYL